MWNSTPIASLCSRVTSGGTPRRDEPSNYAPSEIPWIKTGELNDGDIWTSEESISHRGLENSSAKMLPSGTVLMAMYGATVGALGRLAIPATCNQASCAMVVNPQAADSRWLLYSLMKHRSRIMDLANGAAQQNLNAQIIKSFKLPTPPLPEQQAIAEVLGALDDKIAANRALVATSAQLTESLFTRATRGLSTAPLSSIAIVNGDTLKPGDADLRYIDIAALSTDDYSSPESMSWGAAPSRARRRVHRGDTLWSTVRPNRRARALVLEDDPSLVASTGLVTLSPQHQGFSFLHEATRTEAFADYLVANAEGSAYPAVTASKFDRAPVPAAEADTIIAFNRLADPLWERVGSARAEIRSLASLRNTLLPGLMDGTLRVSTAARVASEAL